MTDSVEIRARIDSENVKALLLINGGGAIALLAFLPSVFADEKLTPLAGAVTWALLAYHAGLFLAVLHNHWRRRCSEFYDLPKSERPRCRLFGRNLREPCICHRSWTCMWLSAGSFFVAGIVVFAGLMRLAA